MPIGQGTNKWRYAIDCHNCAQLRQIGQDRYCGPTLDGKKTIHADDDFVVRCDHYVPAQTSLFEEVNNGRDERTR